MREVPPMPELPEPGAKAHVASMGGLVPVGFTSSQMLDYARSRDAIWAGMLEDAILAERERCAKLCEEHNESAFDAPRKPHEGYTEGYQDAANDIAAAIRGKSEGG